MLNAYKAMISLSVLAHVGGFVKAISQPAEFLVPFGVEYGEHFSRVTAHFGFLLLTVGVFQALAAFWTFKGRTEGLHMGLLAGAMMTLTAVPDLFIVDHAVDVPLVAIGALTVLTASLALRKSDSLDAHG